MPIDVDEPYSPGWWLNHLAGRLHDRRAGRSGNRRFTRTTVQPTRVRPGLELLSDYLAGDPPLREDIHSGWAAPFRQFLRMGRMNIAPKLVSSTTNRMGIRDFRTALANDELGDAEARNLMRRNHLRLKARQVHDWMLGLADGYTIITPPDDSRAWSLITAESPMECITEDDPMSGQEMAGLKMFRDDVAGVDYAYLFLPGELYVARCEAPTSVLWRSRWVMSDRWEWDYDRFDDVPAGRVAMVHFSNKDGKSEIEGHLDTLDRINDKVFNEWWIGKLQAHKQRALEVPDQEQDTAYPGADEDDEDTAEDENWAEIFTSAPDALWKLPKGAKIWESTEADLRQLVESIKGELQWLAFTASKPLHLITPDAANGSAEGATTQKEEHSFEIMDRRDRAEGSWAKTIGLAFEFQGMADRADVSQIECIWGPMELHSLQEKFDAASKAKGTLPTEAVWTDVLQYAPAEVVDRLRTLRSRELLYAVDDTPVSQPGTGPGTGGQ